MQFIVCICFITSFTDTGKFKYFVVHDSVNIRIPIPFFCLLLMSEEFFFSSTGKVLVPNTDSALNMDTPNIFKSIKFDRHIVLHVREEKQLKRQFSLESAKKHAVCQLKKNCFFVVC